MDLPNKKKREDLKEGFVNVVEDNLKVGAFEEDTINRERWRTLICCGNS